MCKRCINIREECINIRESELLSMKYVLKSEVVYLDVPIIFHLLGGG